MSQELEKVYPFENRSYFYLPFLISDTDKFESYLNKSGDWQETQRSQELKTNYILHYAAQMIRSSDHRFRIFSYTQAGSLPLYYYQKRICEKMRAIGRQDPTEWPDLDGVSLYVFDTGIAFLEFKILYGRMDVHAIIEFVYLFRSLRNNEEKDYLGFPAGKISLMKAVNLVLPSDLSGTVLCFSNDSIMKKQACIFTILNGEICGLEGCPEDEMYRCRYHLMHGFNHKFEFNVRPDPHAADFAGNLDLSSQYELIYNVGTRSYWGGSQDGLVCITRRPYKHQFDQLTADYRFLYLLLLNQRFASIAYIEKFSGSMTKLFEIQSIHKKVVDLKTCYAFRVISDDYFVQTIYCKMYDVLELDHLIDDLEETNDQLNEILQKEQNIHGKRFERLLTALSLLAIFSALIDFSDYLDRFMDTSPKNTWISLAVNILIIGVALVSLFFHRKK